MELEKSVQLAEAIAAAVDVDDVHVVEQPVEDRRGEDFVGGVRIPVQAVHRFRSNPSTDSGPSRPPIPEHSVH